MITREGMETALLMNALLFSVGRSTSLAAPSPGTLVAAFVACLWSRYGHRVNLSRFFQVTAVFLLVFVVQLLIYGFHELTEANIFPAGCAGTTRPSRIGPDGVYGQYLTYLLVVLPARLAGAVEVLRAARGEPSADVRRLPREHRDGER